MKRAFDDLALALEDIAPRDLAHTLHRKLRTALLAGRFTPGSRMPSTRSLSRALGVSRNTVVDVYERLVNGGHLTSRHGSGTYVGESIARASAPAPVARDDMPTAAVARRCHVGALPSTAALLACPANFRPGVPDLREFPVREWHRSTNRRLRMGLRTVLDDEQTQGDAQLRAHVAHYLRSSRGVRCSADNLLVTSGAQQAFDLLARVLVTPGAIVAVEDPGYPAAVAIFEAAGATIVTIPVDGEGIVVSALPTNATLVYVTPSHQFPLGVTMSFRRRNELLDWAAAANAWIVEDDYDSEYRFRGQRIESLQGLDPRDRVIYVGTFSKVLLPELRLGYIAMPPSLIDGLLAVKWLADRHTPSLAQAVMAEFMGSGAFAGHLRRMQAIYRKRFDILCTTFADLPPARAYLIPAQAGLHMTLLLHQDTDMPALVAQAQAQGIGLHALEPFCRQPFVHGLVLGFGSISANDLQRGARWLREFLST